MSLGVGHGGGSDPASLWLWRRPAAASAIRPLAQELPYATGAALKRQKKKKIKLKNKPSHTSPEYHLSEKQM